MKTLINSLWLSLLTLVFTSGCKPSSQSSENTYVKPDSIFGDLELALKTPELCKQLIIRNVLPSGQVLSKAKIITAEISQLSQLNTLIIYGPRQDELPAEVGELEKLKVLQIEGYGTIKSTLKIPSLANCNSLNKLVINKCGLASLPLIPKSLTQLEATGNQIKNIPKDLFNNGLEHIDLSQNRIDTINLQSISTRLKYLNLAENNLSTLAMNTTDAIELDYLGLSGNPIERISKGQYCIRSVEAIGVKFSIVELLLSKCTNHVWLTEPLDYSKDSFENLYNWIYANWYFNSASKSE